MEQLYKLSFQDFGYYLVKSYNASVGCAELTMWHTATSIAPFFLFNLFNLINMQFMPQLKTGSKMCVSLFFRHDVSCWSVGRLLSQPVTTSSLASDLIQNNVGMSSEHGIEHDKP